jgi:mersacidin/lichenicidin family type 2 lantibiotic
MNKVDLIRAWKDPSYRATLRADELGALPAHPAGLIELCDDELRAIGGSAAVTTTAPECTLHTFLNWKACGCPVITTAT